jgi:glycosyltransferase involved in cell wall biosynthesis
MRNVLFSSPGWPLSFYPNGIISYVHAMVEELKSFNVNSYVIAASIDANTSIDKNIVDLSTQINTLKTPLERIWDKIYYRLAPYHAGIKNNESQFLKAFKKINDNFTIDIVEMEESFGLSYYIQKKLSIPVIVRLHGPWFLNGKALGVSENHDFFRRIRYEKRAIANAVGITAPSKDVLEQTRNYYGLELKNAHIIPNPAPIISDEKKWTWNKCNPFQITFVGRFDSHKGGDIVIDAFRYVLEKDARISLCFAGPDRGILDHNGDFIHIQDYLQKVFPDAIQKAKIKVLGTLNFREVQDLRLNSYLTIIASRYEIIGYTVIEAMCQGCPIIASNVGGIPEIIKNGYSGLLFEPGDAKDLATKILTLVNNRDLAIKLANNAITECQNNLSPKVIVGQTLDYYKEVERQFY